MLLINIDAHKMNAFFLDYVYSNILRRLLE